MRPFPKIGRGPLTPAELAEAAVLGDVSAVLVLASWVLPGGPVLQAAAATPFAVLALRHRLRAVVVAAIAGGAVAGLVAGPGPSFGIVGVAAVGFVVGFGIRRSWSAEGTLLFGLVTVWAPASAFSVGLLAALPRLRALTLEQAEIAWRAGRKLLSGAGWPPQMIADMDGQVRWAIDHWYFAIPAFAAFGLVIAVLLARWIARPALERVSRSLALPAARLEPDAREPAPVPVRLEGVSFRYPGANADALRDVCLRVPVGAFVAVVGPNGSGKSTLARVLAGAAPATGVVDRPGSAGLGRPGGTALVLQRPETQVIGVRAGDDVVWGLEDAMGIDIDGLLRTVGLEGFGQRETSTLSGGELQRLAVAAALARSPALLVSDESTSMLDPAGRAELVAILRRLPRERGVTVVHVTHRAEEADGADLVVSMDAGRLRVSTGSLP